MNYKQQYDIMKENLVFKRALEIIIEEATNEDINILRNNILYRETDKFIFITRLYLDNKIKFWATCWGCAETKAFPSEEWLNIHDACKDDL